MSQVLAAKLLEEEVRLAPWNHTTDMVNAIQGRGQLTLAPDPSGNPIMLRAVSTKAPIMKKEREKKDEKPKAMVTGTDADLRKLSLEDARLMLLKFGVPDEKIAQLTRWDRIALVRKKSSEAAALSGGTTSNPGELTKARHFLSLSSESYHALHSLPAATSTPLP